MSVANDIEARLLANLGETDETPDFDLEAVADFVMANPGVKQHTVWLEGDGVEELVVYRRVDVLPEQQRVVIHIPVEPALQEIPRVESNLLSDQDGRIRITDIQKFGVRLEVVLSAPAPGNTSILLETTISSI